MKLCKKLLSEQVFWKDTVGFCCARAEVPMIPRSSYTLDKMLKVRNALIKGLNDTSFSVKEYDELGIKAQDGYEGVHPCSGCSYIEEVKPNSKKAIKLEKWKITQVGLIAPNGCNAKCDYCACYNDDNIEFPLRVKTEDSIPPIVLVSDGSKGGPLSSNRNVIETLILEKYIDINTGILFSGGEPSTHRETMEILEMVSGKGFRTTVLTNAIQFSEEIKKSLESGGCKVIVDIDSGDRDSYKLIKGVDKFDIVLENISRYMSAYNGLNNGSFLELKYIIYSKNNSLKIINKYIDIALQLGVKFMCVAFNHNEVEGRGDVRTEKTINMMGYLIYKLDKLGFINIRIDKVDSTLLKKIDQACYRAFVDDIKFLPDSNSIKGLKNYTEVLRVRTFPLDSIKPDLISLINNIAMCTKNIALYGCGEFGYMLSKIMIERGVTPKVIFDKKPVQLNFPNNVPVVHVKDAAMYDIDKIIICSSIYHTQIYQELSECNEFEGIKVIDPFFHKI